MRSSHLAKTFALAKRLKQRYEIQLFLRTVSIQYAYTTRVAGLMPSGNDPSRVKKTSAAQKASFTGLPEHSQDAAAD